jgi:adenine-specific DNA-methyltransferase
MGTKRYLAPQVASLACHANSGPFLDLFSGVCTVAAEVRGTRACWSNDAQLFAANLGAAFLTSATNPLSPHRAATLLYEEYVTNRNALGSRWNAEVVEERKLLELEDRQGIHHFNARLPSVASCTTLSAERQKLSVAPTQTPYRLVSITFAGGYFGLTQSIQIDSIRYAIEAQYKKALIDLDQRRWMCLALCIAAKRIATTTGHFAQYLEINKNNAPRFISQRRRSAWKQWLTALDELFPYGTQGWREKNRAYHTDALALLQELATSKARPAVVYADPPYTKDQYSRYYHLLDTLLRYDYPEATGIGRYPSRRFVSSFSLASSVLKSIEALASGVAKLDATLILSYPEDGLLDDSTTRIPKLLKEHFRRTEVRRPFSRRHSTFGASKGEATKLTNEFLFLAH